MKYEFARDPRGGLLLFMIAAGALLSTSSGLTSRLGDNIALLQVMRCPQARVRMGSLLSVPPSFPDSGSNAVTDTLSTCGFSGAERARAIAWADARKTSQPRHAAIVYVAIGRLDKGLAVLAGLPKGKQPLQANMLGCLYWISGDRVRASQAWAPLAPEAFSRRLLAMAESLRTDERARDFYDAALAVKPGWWRALLALGTYAENTGNVSEWRQSLKEALLDPDMPAFDRYVAKGRLALDGGDTVLAVQYLREATRIRPSHPWPHLLLARALEPASLDKAIDEYRIAVVLDRSFCASVLQHLEVHYARAKYQDLFTCPP